MEFKPWQRKGKRRQVPLCFFLIACCSLPGLAQLGEVVPLVPYLEQTDQSYALYRPSNYTRKKRWPAIVLLDDSGQGQTAVAAFRDAAEAYGFMLASPNNFRLSQEFDIPANPVIWVYQDLIRRFSTDIDGIYFAGMGKASGLMVELAKRLQTNAGLILCSPEEDDLKPLTSFDTTLTVSLGSFDPNYVRVHDFFTHKKPIKNLRMLGFEGGRQWPDAETATEILGWLKVRAHRSRDLPLTEPTQWLHHRLTYAKTLEQQNDLVQAFESWQALKTDFPESDQKADIQKAVARLDRSKTRQSQARLRQEALEKEARTLNLFDSHLKPTLFDRDQALEENLAWWSQQHKTLSYLIQNTSENEQKNTAIRLLEAMWQLSYMDGLTHLEQSRFAPASYHFRLATRLFADKSFAHYALACALAGRGQGQQAIEALEASVAKGLKDPSLVQLQPLFDNLRSDPAFLAISKKIQGSDSDAEAKKTQDNHD